MLIFCLKKRIKANTYFETIYLIVAWNGGVNCVKDFSA